MTLDIYVTKPFLPPKAAFQKYIDDIYEREVLTNQGPLVQQLEARLADYCNTPNFFYVANGTLALQLAIHALNIHNYEIITTPFTYVATISSILWEHCTPVFVDIEPENFTIDSSKIEKAITSKTKAIMPVHVFGYACDIEKIELIAKNYDIKVIYDAAHVFGAKYKGKSLLSYGDIATCSFHATKLFHTVEGGACIVNDLALCKELALSRYFGHIGDIHYQLGINCKGSELHAAMGLANISYVDEIIIKRKRCSDEYDKLLLGEVTRPAQQENLDYNYAYYPIVLRSEVVLQKVINRLKNEHIYPRRYFYPSLNLLPYVDTKSCPVSEDISSRILCLPLYPDLDLEIINKISYLILDSIN